MNKKINQVMPHWVFLNLMANMPKGQRKGVLEKGFVRYNLKV